MNEKQSYFADICAMQSFVAAFL